ncbi:hypothetical protein HER32_18850 [Hymenobacter sp. BT18]|uniref:hypothetical protein n=1 Tax=Hymenobacter sp. BT18 TaxID=2835648 RepID=UPI00143ED339|nr:hypothetical protein [Hymenobacter sp. BT18]QIX63115.1 hypothetical protein HER32_18850 [Hymenobacter sp. BT18]
MSSSPASPELRPCPSGWHQLNTVAAAAGLGLVLAPWLYEASVALGLIEPLAEVSSSCGDTPAQWLALRVGLSWGLLTGISLALAQQWTKRRWAVGAVLLDVIVLYLSMQLFVYGSSKVFATQFPRLWANLDTPPAELTPMRVAWQFFGYSRAYQQFLGWGEVLPAVLLLFRRTRTLGAFVATVVMLNVFVINLFFDVCVKIGSGTYLALALLLLVQDADRLWQFFILHRPAAPRTLPATGARFGPRGRWVYWGLGTLLTLAMLYVVGQDTIGVRAYAAEQAQVLPVTGVWETVQAERWTAGRWQPVAATDSAWPSRAYFQAANAVLRNAFRRDRFITEPDSAQPQSVLQLIARSENNEYGAPHPWQYTLAKPDTLRLLGRWRQDSLRLSLKMRRDLMK